MLYIHTSNKLELLANEYANVVKTPLKNPLETETVVVQNAGMGRWLSMFMADVAGISANTDFTFPADFMWKLLRLVSTNVPDQSPCSPETLRFFIMAELSDSSADYPELHHYILNSSSQSLNEIACWELSCELAPLLDQYLFYRSDWIRDWESADYIAAENNPTENWQARLWRRCIKDNNLVHWLSLQDQFKTSLVKIDKEKLQQRISFFSMSALSPGYLDLLGELGKKTDVHLYIINPCGDIYWGDIQSEKSRAKLGLDEQLLTDVGNPLLASMGKQGRDFIAKLYDLPEAQDLTIVNEDNPTETTLLNQLQLDIYNLTDPKEFQQKTAKDNSIQFNVCHTAMREVEVLHDQILNVLEQDSEIAPSDIVVMMPDVENYAPYIEAVFSSNTPKLPFSITDSKPTDVFNIIEAINKLLVLSDTRFDVESVFELLDFSDIYNHFDLNETQIHQCREFALATNIRWGISAQSRIKDDLPNSEEHTWKYALDRILLGYAMGDHPEGEQLFKSERRLSLLPFDNIEGSDAIMLAKFKQFTDTVFATYDWQAEQHSFQNWIEKIKKLLKKLFSEKSNTTKILTSLDAINNSTKLAGFNQKVSFSVFKKTLVKSLQNITGPEKYLGYGITFCALVPMRSVPFKVVVLMGMNDGDFPHQDKHHSFDLIAKKSRLGDRSRRDEDRYLFLESILAARSKLIISYIGQSIKDNTDIPPSILVSELLDSLKIYSGIEAKDWVCKHPLQAFSPRYYSNSSKLYSYVNEYTKLHQSDKKAPSEVFITERLDELDKEFKTLSVRDLISFYQSPARIFLKHHFAIQTFDEEVTLPIREPFELGFFDNRDVRNIIQEGIHQNIELSHENILIARAKGLLPHGEIGDAVFNNETQTIQNFTEQLPTFEFKDSPHIALDLGEFHLYGDIKSHSKTGRIVQQVTQPYFRDYIDLWINHLALNTQNLSAKQKQSSFHSPEKSFTLSPVDNAEEQLKQLLEYYWKGLHFPLAFFPKSAFKMYEKTKNGYPNQKQATDAWIGSDFTSGERGKFENWLLHRTVEMDVNEQSEEFIKTSQLVFGEMYSCFVEL